MWKLFLQGEIIISFFEFVFPIYIFVHLVLRFLAEYKSEKEKYNAIFLIKSTKKEEKFLHVLEDFYIFYIYVRIGQML